MTETLIGLVSRYSPSGQEQEAAEWLTGRMQALGFDQAFVDAAGNAVGVMGNGARQAVLLGHIDTVPGEISTRVETSGSDEGGVLYGRGAVDAKGPLACFVDAAAQVGRRAGWQMVVIGAVEEERNSAGARFIVERYQPEFVVVGEPNRWDRVALGYKGAAYVDVIVRRPQTHTASGRQTAAEAAVQAWLEVKAFVEAFNAEKPHIFDHLLPTLCELESGGDGFEQWARIRLGVRLPVEMPPDDWYARLSAMIPEADVQQTGYAIPAWVGEKNHRLTRAFLSAIRSQGGAPSFVHKTGTCDVNIVAPAWQCPALVYGPGDSALDHTPNEHISLDEYRRAVNVLSFALKELTR